MKHLMIAATAILVLTGCHTNNNQGMPGEDRHTEGPNDRSTENRTSDNIRDVGRQGSPTSPFSAGNGTGNF